MLKKHNSENFSIIKNKQPIKILYYKICKNINKNNGNLNLSHSQRFMKLTKNTSFFNNSKSLTKISQTNNQSNVLEEDSKLKNKYHKFSSYKNTLDNSFENNKGCFLLKNENSKIQKNFPILFPKIKIDNSLLKIKEKIQKIESKKFIFNKTKFLNKLYKNESFFKFQKIKINSEKSRYLKDINNNKNIKHLKNFIEILTSIIKKIKEINLKYFIFKTQIIGEKKEENKSIKKHKSMFKIKPKIYKDFNIFKKDLEIKKIKKKYKLQQEIYLYNLRKKLNLFDNLNYSTIYKQRYYIAEKINLGWDQAYAYKKNGRKIIRNSSKYINENKELEKKKIKLTKPDSFLI